MLFLIDVMVAECHFSHLSNFYHFTPHRRHLRKVREMNRRSTLKMLAAMIPLASITAIQYATRAAAQDLPQVYGSQLMTQQERFEHRQRLMNATTAEERERIRTEHHQEMQKRAKERGVTLPETPPAQGMGKGRSQGQGKGQKSGKGLSG